VAVGDLFLSMFNSTEVVFLATGSGVLSSING
jgi:ferredoxin-NADP reductase